MVAGVIRNQSPLNFLLNQTLICYCRSQVFQLCYIFKTFVSYLYIMILPYILVTSLPTSLQHTTSLSIHPFVHPLFRPCNYPHFHFNLYLDMYYLSALPSIHKLTSAIYNQSFCHYASTNQVHHPSSQISTHPSIHLFMNYSVVLSAINSLQFSASHFHFRPSTSPLREPE
jgi:hypothetical protein